MELKSLRRKLLERYHSELIPVSVISAELQGRMKNEKNATRFIERTFFVLSGVVVRALKRFC